MIRQIIWVCTKCKIHEGRTCNHSFNQPHLPSSWVSINLCFTNLSVDYAGSLLFMTYTLVVEFTKHVFFIPVSLTRGICLELESSHNSAAYIKGLSRFFRWRGTLSSILSKNGTNFGSEEIYLSQQFICLRNIKCNFKWLVMRWWGGVYVIIIRCVKCCLKNALDRKTVT